MEQRPITTLQQLQSCFKQQEKLESHLCLVTPELANQILSECNTLNRPMSLCYAKRLADQLECGEWKLTGETISFSKAWELINGQHRLMGIKMSGVSALMLIAWGVDAGAYDVIDIGRKRMFRDILAVKEKGLAASVCGDIASSISNIGRFLVMGGELTTSSPLLCSASEKMKFFEGNKEEFFCLREKAISAGSQTPPSIRKIPISLRISAMFLSKYVSGGTLSAFWDDVLSNSPSPLAVIVREKLAFLRMDRNFNTSEHRVKTMEILISGVYAFENESKAKTAMGFSRWYLTTSKFLKVLRAEFLESLRRSL